MTKKTLIERLDKAGGRIDLVELCWEAKYKIIELEAEVKRLDKQDTLHHADLMKMCDVRDKLEAQIEVVKEMIALYFEGCDCDIFDDKMRELQAALSPKDGEGNGW